MSEEEQKTVFVLDTNVLFELSVWMPPHLNKVFWQKLAYALKESKWVLLDVVVNEVKKGGALKKWCQDRKNEELITIVSVQQRARGIEINNAHTIIDETSQKSVADVYLLAYAEEKSYTIFTREGHRRNNTGLYKIPDICQLLKITYMRTPDKFYEAMNFRF